MCADHEPDEVESLVRLVAPQVLATLVRRRESFAAAEDAVQDAVVEALRVWPEHPARDPSAWLLTVATRRLIDARRSESARSRREATNARDQDQGATESGDDTLMLLFLCCHPDLSPASQIALTLRAVGGLTTAEIADAFFVPEATMAQRISRAKRMLRPGSFTEPGDLAVVLRVLSLIYHAGHGRRPELAGEAIRLTRQLTLASPEPEARGLLALMLLQHARLPARTDAAGRFVPLDEQDRTRWDSDEIAQGVEILQAALAEGCRGRYQIQAAIAALHSDAPTPQETDWEQILEWYDELVRTPRRPRSRRPGGGAQPCRRRRPRCRSRRRPRRDRTRGGHARRPAAVVRRTRLPVRDGRRLREGRRRLRRRCSACQRSRRAGSSRQAVGGCPLSAGTPTKP